MVTYWKRKIHRINRPDYKILAIASVIFVGFLTLFVIFSPQRDSIGRYLAHTWRSVSKFSNIVYPLRWPFAKSELLEYRIVVNPDNWKIMEDSLPINDDLTYGSLLEDNKSYVNGEFIDPKTGYNSKIKVRYRGITYNNWQFEKKSLRLKFPKDNLFQGMRALNLIIPEDRGYYLEPLNNYRAKKLGLFVPDFKFVHIFINNRDFGVYLFAEPWSGELSARNGIIDTNNIFSNNDEPGEVDNDKPAFLNWKSYIAANEAGPFEELDVLKKLTNEATDEQFNRIVSGVVDLDKVYKWQLINVLAGSAHQSYFSNFVLMFKKETGKFEPVPWNVEFESLKDKIYDDNLPLLVRRILKNKKYSDEFVDILKDYLNDPKNLTDDVAYYDKLFENTKNDFYRDNAKNSSNFSYLKKVNSGRGMIINNFEKAKNLLADGKTGVTIWEKQNYKKGLSFSGSFEYLNSASLGINEFLVKNPEFRQISSNRIAIGPGNIFLSKTTIIPRNLKLIIEPGTNLYFYPKTSLISYSSVTAIGTLDAPIVFAPALKDAEPWGSFGVINTGHNKNYFKHISVNGGSSDTINGVFFTSQFSLHNADSVIENSIFENARSDDGVHVILGSLVLNKNLFRNNSSDSLDLDYVKVGSITNNKFINTKTGGNNGDGIDLSGTEDVEVSNNEILAHGDKGISVGEKAKAVIINNIIAGCSIGMAVKDDSDVKLDKNIIIKNRDSGLVLYRKKPEFIRGGTALVSNTVLWGNKKEIDQDSFSFLSIKDSTVEGGYGKGENIDQKEPDFNSIIPAYINSFLNR